MSDDLRLNSIDRFTKMSDRLILEEHGSCEVPAGCGGVVLRWRNPNDGVPLVLYGHYPATSEIFIDGQLAPSSRVLVPPGEHQLAIKLTDVHPPRIFIWRMVVDVPGNSETTIASGSSMPDGTWRISQDVNDDDLRTWTFAELDDSAWTPMTASRVDIESLDQNERWRYRIREEHSHQRLDLLPTASTLWIRTKFTVEAQSS